jgi:hypothetical protein
VEASLRVQAQRAREAIAAGALRGAALAGLLRSVPPDRRDAFVDEVLGIDDPSPPDVPDLPRGSVPYLPCGVDEVLAMVAEVPLGAEDVLVDLGSGLGRVVILGHLLTGARARGVEIQGPLVALARKSAAALALPGVSFVEGDALDVELEGSVFFLYAPFNGGTLRRVLHRLRQVAERHPVVVCAVGTEFRDEDWLAPRTSTGPALTIYESGGVSRGS